MTDPLKLHALADGELDPKEASALRDALRLDPRAAAEMDAILNLKEALATKSLRHADDEVWKACVGRLNGIDKARRAEGFVGRYAWAMCGFLFLFILSGRFAMRSAQGDSARVAEIVPSLSRRATTPAELREAQYYAELLNAAKGDGLDPKRVEPSGPASEGFFHGLHVAQVPLRDGAGDLLLTIVDGALNATDTAPMDSNPGFAASAAQGVNSLVWRTPGRTWLVSGGRSLSQLGELASRLLGAR